MPRYGLGRGRGKTSATGIQYEMDMYRHGIRHSCLAAHAYPGNGWIAQRGATTHPGKGCHGLR